MKKQLIAKDMLVADIVMQYPSTAKIIMEYGLHCVGCGVSEYETLEEGTVGHGMTEEDLELMLVDLNEEAKKIETTKKEKEQKKSEKK